MRPEVVFEVSYEAGNEIGGIYTVLNSKSQEMIESFEDNYILIGPYFQKNEEIEFEIKEPPSGIKEVFEELKNEGIKAYWTSWIEDEDANLILLDVNKFRNRRRKVDYKAGKDIMLNFIKQRLWKKYGIDSLFMGEDFNKNIIWAWAAGKTIEKLVELERFSNKKVVAHFHEWQSGAGLLYLGLKTDVPTVFTTHATNLGRTLSSHNPRFMEKVYKELEKDELVDPQLARQYKIEGKHQIEKVCARKADCFTTVGKPVAKEAEYVLGKAPDVLTPNAFEVEEVEKGMVEKKKGRPPESYESYLTWKLFSRHRRYKKKIKQLIEAMFWPHYLKPFDEFPFIYTSGRYELKNKGFDLFLNALGEVNRKEGKGAIAFVFVPTTKGVIKEGIEKNLLLVDEIEDKFEDLNLKEEERKEVIRSIETEEELDFLGEEAYSDIRKWFLKLEEFDGPPISCFDVPKSDRLYSLIKENGLNNEKDNRIKVVYYPVYLKPGDGVLNLEYYDVINGCDLGVFPSRYEPWGYTPMEAAAFLNVAITTNYSGFGKHVISTGKGGKGLRVLDLEPSEKEVIGNLSDMIGELIDMSEKERNELKIDARKAVLDYNWEKEIRNYLEAYERALSKS